jgi:hypothetical protein
MRGYQTGFDAASLPKPLTNVAAKTRRKVRCFMGVMGFLRGETARLSLSPPGSSKHSLRGDPRFEKIVAELAPKDASP